MTDPKEPTPSDVPRNYLAAFVYLHNETSLLPEESRARAEREKFDLLAQGWRLDVGDAAAARAALVPLARATEGEAFARWLEALFEQCADEEPR